MAGEQDGAQGMIGDAGMIGVGARVRGQGNFREGIREFGPIWGKNKKTEGNGDRL